MGEQNEKVYNVCCCECKSKKNRKCCIDIVIYVLSILLAATLGLIIGSIPAIAAALFAVIAALIVLAVVLLILIVVRIIELACKNNNKC